MWNLKVIDTSKPLYISVADALERDIHAGILQPGDILPTHRALAEKVGVAVTTATRAYLEAEKRGLITAVVGKGTFVTADAWTATSVFSASQEEMPIEMGLTTPINDFAPPITSILEKILASGELHRLLQYTYRDGMNKHREIGAEWIRRFGINASGKDVLVTAGGQHALFCTLYSLFEAGDRIAVAQLTYPGIKAAARKLGLRLEGVAMDEQGIIPEELENLCKRVSLAGIYAVGRMQNPTNVKPTNARREALAKVIRRNKLILIENDAYGFLWPKGDYTLSGLLPRQSVYISSLSKAFHAGLRIAFLHSAPKLRKEIVQGVVDTMILASPLSAEIVCQCISQGMAEKMILSKREELRQRVDLFCQKLIGYEFECSELGMCAWLKLPDHWRANDFETALGKLGLRLYAADKFVVGPVVPPNYVRISLSGPKDMDNLEQGLNIVVSVLADKNMALKAAVRRQRMKRKSRN